MKTNCTRTSTFRVPKYLVRDRQGGPLACALFGSAAGRCAARDQWPGWDPATRARHLQRVSNNPRFLIVPGVGLPHLASHVLGPLTWRREVTEHQAETKRGSVSGRRVIASFPPGVSVPVP